MPQERMTIAEFRNLPKTDKRQKDKAPRRQEEFNHQCSFFEILEQNLKNYPFLKFIFSSTDGAFKPVHIAAREKKAGMKRGVPDVHIPFQRRLYPGAYIENKFGDNRLSPEQKEFRDHLLSEGYCVKICYSVDEALEFIEWYFSIELIK